MVKVKIVLFMVSKNMKLEVFMIITNSVCATKVMLDRFVKFQEFYMIKHN